jgi:hypothetical protein
VVVDAADVDDVDDVDDADIVVEAIQWVRKDTKIW